MSLQVKNVLISDAVDASCSQILQQHGINVVSKCKMSKNQLLCEIQNYEGLIVRSDTKVTTDVLEAATNLQLIGRAGTGVDNIDCQAATRRGILVMNTPNGNTISAAEHTCAMIAALARNIPQACASVKGGAWNRKAFMGNELYGKTLAILGLGRIGREVAFRMQAFGMQTIGFDPIISAEVAKEYGVVKMQLDEIWPQADFITVHTPLIPQTKNLINETVLKKCKKGVRIVNVARGGIVDEMALLPALASGQCGGVALDVYAEEPPQNEYYSKLLQHPCVICTPHLGASTTEAQKRVAQEIAQQLVDLAEGRAMTGIVNAPALDNILLEDSKPWIQLAKSLGVTSTGISSLGTKPEFKLEITTYGEGMEKKNFLNAAVLVGQLIGMTENGINMINAPIIAQEAGIQVSTKYVPEVPPEVNGLKAMQVTIHREGGSHSVLGTVHGDAPTLYALDGAAFDNGVTFEGNMLFFHSENDQNGLTTIIGALTDWKGAISTVIRSSPNSAGTSWYIVRTTKPVDNADLMKFTDAKYVAQCSF